MAGVAPVFPYLSDAMVAYTARLDPACKLDGDAARGLFRESLRGVLPTRAARGHGRGLAPPVGQWLLADARLRGLAFDSLATLRSRGIVRPEFIDLLLSRKLAEDPARHGKMVWLLMMLEQWFAQRRHGVPASVAPLRDMAPART
jgi:asparagine synthase (glutamine-hydrolysing)